MSNLRTSSRIKTWRGKHRYAYVHNLQGDVIALIDTACNIVVQYSYDAWGRPLSKTGSLKDTLGTINPFRYRGYVFDEETGLYYTINRYIDPQIGRFLNGDEIEYLGINGEHSSHNLFTYCLNRPVDCLDSQGRFPLSAMLGGGLAGALISAVSYAVSCGLAGKEIETKELCVEVFVGFVSGALGGWAGIFGIKDIRGWGLSMAAGVVAGIKTGLYSEGTTPERAKNGVIAGAATFGGSLAGTFVGVEGLGPLANAYVNYCGALFAGTPFELLSVSAQNFIAPSKILGEGLDNGSADAPKTELSYGSIVPNHHVRFSNGERHRIPVALVY